MSDHAIGSFEAAGGQVGERLDRALQEALPDLSRTAIQRLVEEGHVRVSGKPARAGYRLRAAVVETPRGSYFVKLVGPEKTVTQWNDSFLSYLRSFEFK